MRDTDGKLWLSLVNLDPHRARDVTVDVSGFAVRSARGEVLTAPNVNSINTFDAPDTVVPAFLRLIADRPPSGRIRAHDLLTEVSDHR